MILKLVDLGCLTHFTPFQPNPNQPKWVTKWVALQNKLCILTQSKNRKKIGIPDFILISLNYFILVSFNLIFSKFR